MVIFLSSLAVNPSPHPPSPGTQEETQRVLRRENSESNWIRDYFRTGSSLPNVPPPRRPRALRSQISESGSCSATAGHQKKKSRARSTQLNFVHLASPYRRMPSLLNYHDPRSFPSFHSREHPFVELDLIERANGHLQGVQIASKGSICSRSELLRTTQSIKNTENCTTHDGRTLLRERENDVLEGVFRLIDFLLD